MMRMVTSDAGAKCANERGAANRVVLEAEAGHHMHHAWESYTPVKTCYLIQRCCKNVFKKSKGDREEEKGEKRRRKETIQESGRGWSSQQKHVEVGPQESRPQRPLEAKVHF